MAIDEFADRAAISDVVFRYGRAIDARDVDGVSACFTEDVHLEYFGGALEIDGVAALRSLFTFDGDGGAIGVDEILQTTHVMALGEITVAGDRASVTSRCVAYVLATDAEAGVLVTRGLHYTDELQRTTEGWKIGVRRHSVDWETRSPATTPPPAR